LCLEGGVTGLRTADTGDGPFNVPGLRAVDTDDVPRGVT
jgi:hypothetical protein